MKILFGLALKVKILWCLNLLKSKFFSALKKKAKLAKVVCSRKAEKVKVVELQLFLRKHIPNRAPSDHMVLYCWSLHALCVPAMSKCGFKPSLKSND